MKMNEQNVQTLTMPLLIIIFTLSFLFTSLAAVPGEGSFPAEETPGISRVILAGASRSAAETDEEAAVSAAKITANHWEQGRSLGNFITTGYCNCEKCSGGHSLTYSGTVPQAGRTISADLTLFPLGTRLIIGDVVYTVEDMGSSVNGHRLDIYYDEHAQAVAHGMKTEEVFALVESAAP